MAACGTLGIGADEETSDDDLPMTVKEFCRALIGGMEVTPSGLLFYLGTKHTACLAPEKCGVDGTGCC